MNGSANERVGYTAVEILDETGRPVSGVAVLGYFRGGVEAALQSVTNADGVALFQSPRLVDPRMIAFHVDGVAHGSGAALQPLDRALRIDSCSLALLASFAQGLETGAAAALPLTLVRDADAHSDAIPAVSPLNLLMDPAPHAVAVDADWFHAAFPDAGLRQVIGASSDRLAFDGAWSFPTSVAAPAASACTDLLVRTSPAGTSVVPDPSGNCADDACNAPLAAFEEMWIELGLALALAQPSGDIWLTGIGTSPVDGDEYRTEGIGTSPVDGDEYRTEGIGTSPVDGDGYVMAGIGTSPVDGGEYWIEGIGTSPVDGDGYVMAGIGTSPVDGGEYWIEGIGTSP